MEANGEYWTGLPDRELWRKSRATESSGDEAPRLLDLAGFADGRLDADDQERVADWLAGDPAAVADVAAARALGEASAHGEAPSAVIARACALVANGPPNGTVVAFRRRPALPRLRLSGLAQWGSLAAALVIAGWLGFALGMDASQSFVQSGQAGEDGVLHEFLDPSTGFLRDLTGGTQT